MPKRPNPSEESGKDEPKKARTVSSPDGGDDAGLVGEISAAAVSSVGRVSEVAARARVAAAELLSQTTDKPAQTSSLPVPPSSVGSAIGGNALLKALRAMPNSMTSKDNGEAKKPATLSSTPVEKESPIQTVANGSATPTIEAKEPVVPFPHLPLENESKLKRWAPALLLFISPLNIAGAVYFGSQKSWNNINQMKRDLEISKLRDELSKRQNEVNVLKNHMNTLEQARGAKKRVLANEKEVLNELFGTEDGGEVSYAITSKERNKWFEKLRLLEGDTKLTLDKFTSNLLEFETVSLE